MTDKVLSASATPSPEALLKQVVLGAKAAAETTASPAKLHGRRVSGQPLAVAGAALLLGGLLGAGLTAVATGHDTGSSTAFGALQQRFDAVRAEADRQAERTAKILAQIQDTLEASRSEAKTRVAALTERVGRAEQGLTTKITSMSDRLEQAEKEQSARLAALITQIEKRAASVPSAPAPQAAKAAPEPTETGALPDKPKPAPTENWALREVYDGIAILEDRKRRLVEVAPGDTVPGIGRVETIERRGKTWVVVTKQGTITHQTW